jgi:hypothetical protein
MCDHGRAAQRVSPPLNRLLFPRQKDCAVPCETQANLVQVWAKATRELSDSTAALIGDHIGKMTRAEYQQLLAQAEQARLAAENVRLTLELHRRDHGC